MKLFPSQSATAAGLLFLTLLLCARIAYAQNPPTANRFALLVGVCELQAPALKKRWLYATRNDIARFQKVLVEKRGYLPSQIHVLSGVSATRTAILTAIEEIAAKADTGDSILFYFTGHGILVPPRPKDNPSQLYKAFVPYDVGVTTVKDAKGTALLDIAPDSVVRNSEVVEILQKSRCSRVALILDSCHSGIQARGRGQIKTLKDLVRTPEIPLTQRGLPKSGDENATFIVLTACRANETALCWPMLTPTATETARLSTATDEQSLAIERRQSVSVFTHFLLERLENPTLPVPTWGDLNRYAVEKIAARQAEWDNPQTPEAEGYLENAAFPLSNKIIPPVPEPKPLINPIILPAEKLRVAIEGNSLPTLTARLKADLSEEVRFINPESETIREITIYLDAKASVFRRGNTLLPALTPITDEETRFTAIRDRIRDLDALHRFIAVRPSDTNSAKMRVDMRVNGEKSVIVKIGGLIELTATNTGSKAGYLYVVDVDPTGKVTVLFPNSLAAENRIAVGEKIVLPAPGLYRLRVRGPEGPEIVKAILSESPLQLPALGTTETALSALPGASHDRLFALLREFSQSFKPRGIGLEGIPQSKDWAADVLLLKILPELVGTDTP